jgi:pimeloyl-ACP methyl ester carboxylesterase
MRGEFVDLDGARLYYYAAGSRGAGEPVVFLHGFGTSGHLWSDVVSLMPAGHRLIVVDLLGHGRSDPPNGRPLSLRAHGDRVIALLDTLRVPTACIVGHGLGGGIAQSIALEHPDRVSRLALVNSIAFDDWQTRDVTFARAAMPLLRHLPSAWLLSMVRSELERGYADATRAAHALDRHETRALSARLRDITVPASVMWGAGDPFLPLAAGRRLANAIPGAMFEVVSDARHFLPEEAPRHVADALGRLLIQA